MPDPFVVITLDGPPRGKGRPRGRIVSTRGGGRFISFYTDSDTRAYEAALACAGKAAMKGLDALDEPLSIVVDAMMPIPESWSRPQKQRAACMDLFPTGKPDGDNLLKCAGDALNGIVWRDDSLIVRQTVQKVYAIRPQLRVSVYRWNQ